MRNTVIFILLAIVLVSCENKKETYSEFASMEMEEEIMPITRQAGLEPPPPSLENTYTADKKIIKDARIGVSVEDFKEFRLALDSVIKKVDGYISNDNLDKNDYNISCNLTIRIPANNFERFISFLENGKEKLLYKNISARDVTEEFIDIEARLRTKREVEKRYIQLLSKARNVKEILEVEEKLRVLREEIESKEGRLNYLKKQVAYSTINLYIIQELEFKYHPEKEKNFFQRLFKSLDRGWKGFITFLLFLFRIWPLIIISLITFYYIRKIRRKKKQEKLDREAEANKQRISKKRYYNKPKQSKNIENKPKLNN